MSSPECMDIKFVVRDEYLDGPIPRKWLKTSSRKVQKGIVLVFSFLFLKVAELKFEKSSKTYWNYIERKKMGVNVLQYMIRTSCM